ncbi:MAG TPA: ATP-dependent DNA helicase [Patescibacteria group bacterium]|nr:ATP-dependent DNA helicase [Patescibacteria group bacterium]
MSESTLNPEQQQAVEHGQGPLLIIAGAGTGKTTVITKRIQHLILEKKVYPQNILALTFTEKAAAEMQERVDEILPYGYSDMWIETFHAFCDRILRLEAIHLGLDPTYDLFTEAESLLFLKKHLFQLDLDYFRPLGNPMKFLQGMLQHFSRLKDDDISPEDYLKFAEKLKKSNDADSAEIKQTFELANAYKIYEELKSKNNVMDFSDLISNVLKLFRTRKHILKKYQEQFQYVLVDEFQDTNYAQNEMAILLSGEKQNITVVGDDDQSIYRWRGAAIANMLQFRSHFPKAEVITLNKNYRSTQTILDSAYQMIQNNNPDRLEVKEKIDKKLTGMKEKKETPVTFLLSTNADEEAETIAKIIRENAKKNNRQYNDYAILVRANDHATPFQRSLERYKIPYQFLGPGHLFEQPEIKDLISYLRVLANFEDTASLYRILTLDIFEIEARDIAALLNYSKRNNLSLFETLEQVDSTALTPTGKEKIKRIIEMLKKHLEKVPKLTAGQILYYFFEDSGLMGYYLDPKTIKTERQAQNVAKFFEKLQSFAANHEDASVFAIVDWIELSMTLGESPLSAEMDWSANNAVNILTVHSSKGLEFPVVFVVNLVTQRFPSRDRKEQIPVPQELIREELPTGDENLQEERRLFYVAMTRAKDQLYLTAAKFYGEGRRERKLSPFVIEALGKECIDKIFQKHNLEQNSQQLSLLDMFNDNIKNGSNEPTANAPFPASSLKPQASYPITYISYSQIQTYDVCPLHYKLRYILNFPSSQSPALSYGISVHNTLRDCFLNIMQNRIPEKEQLAELLKKNWLKQGYSSKVHEQKAYEQASKLLTDYMKKCLEEKPQTLAVELPFQFWLNKVKVGGRIDRIDQLPDGRIEIIDYKTGNNTPDEKKLLADMQLTFYSLAASEIKDKILNRKPEEIVLTLYYIEQDKKFTTTRSAEQLEEAKQFIQDKITEISQSDFHCSHSRLCSDCEYKMICNA